ncbi:MAG: transposase [Planctomycetaceae bacterium]|nr:transposase [Planctomycetaceae bacterium]
MLQKLERLYPLAEKIHVILDNARYYHSKEVRDWLARHKNIKLPFLPGYIPNLNLIERLWKFFNEKVRNNRYDDTFSKFTEACKSFFRCRKKWTEELRTRITQNFHQFKKPIFQGTRVYFGKCNRIVGLLGFNESLQVVHRSPESPRYCFRDFF